MRGENAVPPGLSQNSHLTNSFQFTFAPQFLKFGLYHYYCSIHNGEIFLSYLPSYLKHALYFSTSLFTPYTRNKTKRQLKTINIFSTVTVSCRQLCQAIRPSTLSLDLFFNAWCSIQQPIPELPYHCCYLLYNSSLVALRKSAFTSYGLVLLLQ